ncbi:unnamed protein product [Parajaminaea phylloscopi]
MVSKLYHSEDAFRPRQARDVFAHCLNDTGAAPALPTPVPAVLLANVFARPSSFTASRFLVSSLAAHIRVLRDHSWAPDNSLLQSLFSEYEPLGLARFVLARVTRPDILLARCFADAAAILAAHSHLDAGRANTEGTYHIFTRYGEREGSYTGKAVERVVGQQAEEHSRKFELRTGADQPGLYRRNTSARISFLVTVTPHSCADERKFLGLNAAVPVGCRFDSAQEIADAIAVVEKRRTQEERREQAAAYVRARRQADFQALASAIGMPARLDNGRITVHLGNRWQSVEAPVWCAPVDGAIFRVEAGRSAIPPQSASPLVLRFLKAFRVLLNGRVVDFAGVGLGSSQWGSFVESMAQCQLTSPPEPLALVTPMGFTGCAELDDFAACLTDSRGASFVCGDQGSISLCSELLTHLARFAALEAPPTDPTWTLPAALSAVAGDTVIVRTDLATNPGRIVIRKPFADQGVAADDGDVFALILISLARHILALPRVPLPPPAPPARTSSEGDRDEMEISSVEGGQPCARRGQR